MSLKISINTNKSIRESIQRALKENGGYCPCRIDKSEDTKCICKDFREQKTEGACHCGLYIKSK